MYKLLGISRRMREADNKSIFLSVVGVYVVRTSSLNDMHSCQLFRKTASLSSLVLLSSPVSMANLSFLLAPPSPVLGFSSTSPRINLLRVAKRCFSWFSIFSFSRHKPFFHLFFSL